MNKRRMLEVEPYEPPNWAKTLKLVGLTLVFFWISEHWRESIVGSSSYTDLIVGLPKLLQRSIVESMEINVIREGGKLLRHTLVPKQLLPVGDGDSLRSILSFQIIFFPKRLSTRGAIKKACPAKNNCFTAPIILWFLAIPNAAVGQQPCLPDEAKVFNLSCLVTWTTKMDCRHCLDSVVKAFLFCCQW